MVTCFHKILIEALLKRLKRSSLPTTGTHMIRSNTWSATQQVTASYSAALAIAVMVVVVPGRAGQGRVPG